MKVYTEVAQKNYDQVKPESINDNTRLVVGEYNGRLNGQNMPVNALNQNKFIPPTGTDAVIIDVKELEWIGQTQSYYRVRRWNTYEDGINIHRPMESIDLNNFNWSSGWNNLTEVSTEFERFYIEFQANSGTLNGCFDINFRHGVDRILVEVEGEPSVQTFSEDWYTRWGLFCNDVLIAETGRCYPRLENLSIPFHLFVGTQPVRLELKWQTVNYNANEEFGYSPLPYSRLEIYGANIWVCNTKR